MTTTVSQLQEKSIKSVFRACLYYYDQAFSIGV
jgi:hypothetical protein